MSISFPKSEEEVAAYWKEIDAFQTQIRLTKGNPRFTFYDGPPFGRLSRFVRVSGLPQYLLC